MRFASRFKIKYLQSMLEKTKSNYQIELADALAKHEEARQEVRNWETMYQDWMKLMESRVDNINRTHSLLQVTIGKIHIHHYICNK